ncbi:MAG: universal stress protein [Actinomycetota bacterium]|nr:universal stress protein [Actinomycetota bacterium]
MTAQDDIHDADGAGHRFAAMGPVLLCHDGSHHADRAVRRAATLLRPRDAVVLGLRRGPSGAGGGESGRRLALDAGFEPVAVASAGHGPMAEAVLEQAHRRDVSVIVLGSDGGASSPSRVLGGMPAALVDRSDLPVLVVPPEVPPFAASEPILMCYDGSPPARRALTMAAGLLMGRAAIVVAFMPAVDDVAILRSALPSPVAGAVQDGLARLHREAAEAPAERALEGARTAAAAGFLPRPAGIRGIDASSDEDSDPFKRLLRTAATEDAACIVVGHRRSATRLESTAHGLVHHADRPVLVIPGAP